MGNSLGITNRSKRIATMLLTGIFLLAGMTATGQKPETRPQPQESQEDWDVSDAELETFVQIVEEVDSINQEASSQMVEVVEENDMQVERYNSIVQEMQGVDDVSQLDLDDETVNNVREISQKIQTIRTETNQKIGRVLQSKGWSQRQFDTLVQLVNNDPQIRERYHQIQASK